MSGDRDCQKNADISIVNDAKQSYFKVIVAVSRKTCREERQVKELGVLKESRAIFLQAYNLFGRKWI